MAETFRHAMPFGTALHGDRTQFRLWAPAQRGVRLALESGSDRVLDMRAEPDGWFTAEIAAPAGTLYRFVLEDGTRVPDPASRFQPRDVHGPSEVIDPTSYRWRTGNWRGRPWEDAVVYEAHVGCFTPDGTYDGMLRKLDALVDVGVTALELMPLADFEGRWNWGYDGVLPFAPDSAYGRPDDLKRLIDAAHARSLMVLLDVVYNHFGPSGNYLGLYAPGFFTDRHTTPWGPAMNFEDHGLPVRRFFIENALYWLSEYRFDGLRLDAVHAIRDDSKPDVVQEIAAAVRAHFEPDRHIHLVLENADNASRYLDPQRGAVHTAQWNDDFHHAAHIIGTGESYGYYIDFATAPVTVMAKCLATGFYFQGEPSAHWQGRRRGEDSRRLPVTAFVDFLQNHDQIGNRADAKRIASLVPEAPLRALTAVLLLSPHIPMLFMGEEWASERRFHFFCDFAGDLRRAVREGRQNEFAHMRKDEPGGAEAAEIDPNDPAIFRDSQLDWGERDRPRQSAHLAFVRELLALRRRHVIPRLPDIMLGAHYDVRDGQALRVQWPLRDGGSFSLAANLSATRVDGLAWRLPGTEIYATASPGAGEMVDCLPPWSLCLRITQRPAG